MNEFDKKYLSILHDGRKNLVNDFLKNEPEIFNAMYDYEENYLLMGLAIQKYFFSWQDSHYEILENYAQQFQDPEENDLFKRTFFTLFIKFLSNLNTPEFSQNYFTTFIKDLNKSRIDIITDLINSGKKSEKDYNDILLLIKRNSKIFKSEIKKYKGEN